jgi:hypothetical protein
MRRGRGVAVLVVALLLLAAGCCTGHPVAEKALKDGISANVGHMADGNLPDEARAIARVNHDFLWQVLYGITGEELPVAVRARMDARKKKEDGQ